MKVNSPDAHVFVLIHKMDLIREDLRDSVLQEKDTEIRKKSAGMNLTIFGTSIWDETLYKVRQMNCTPSDHLFKIVKTGLVIHCLLFGAQRLSPGVPTDALYRDLRGRRGSPL